MKQEVELKSFGDALRKSILQYRWIARHGGGYNLKLRYFIKTKKPTPSCECYLCEWSQIEKGICTSCIKYGVWSNLSTACPCLHPDSPYKRWNYTRESVFDPRPEGVPPIIEALRAALKRYNKEEKENKTNV